MNRKLSMYILIPASLCLLIAFISWRTVFFKKEESVNTDVTSYVDPRIGNISRILAPTLPAMYLPNQMIRVYPIRRNYNDNQITCFPLINVGYGAGEMFALRPWTSTVNADTWKTRFAYSREKEDIHPWYYSTYLTENNIEVEFSPGKKTGIYRFTFPGNATQKVLMNSFGHTNSWTFTGTNELTGTETYTWNVTGYLYGQFSAAGTASISDGTKTIQSGTLQGNDVKSVLTFAGNKSKTLEFRYAISYISAEQAKKSYDTEIAGKSFADVVQNGKNIWAEALGQIQVEGGTEAQKRAFYTALYRCRERMTDITEYTNTYYSAYNRKTNTDSRPFYVDDWVWDTYLTLHPLRTILTPAEEEDMLQSYVRIYEQSGSMPTFPTIYGDTRNMTAFHTAIIFQDAYSKGLRNFDVEKAYEGLRKDAINATTLPWRKAPLSSLDKFYQTKGYIPALKPGEPETVADVNKDERRQAVSVTLANGYDDWAMSQLAKSLGKQSDAALFAKRSLGYKNLWNARQQFFMPKDALGNWIQIDPAWDGGQGGRDYYTEGNGWTYIWGVQQDVGSLISLFGSKKAMEDKLDAMFTQSTGVSESAFLQKFPDAGGLTGQFGMGNEPSFHIPYLYNYTGAPWKTQSRIRYLLNRWFTDQSLGMAGDDDGGAMSAFYVFSAMGFYPVTPGLPVFTIGSPLFQKVAISLPGNKKFIITAANSSDVNKYIQSATLNGKVLNSPWITYKQIMAGATLNLVMGASPNKDWGKAGIDALKSLAY